MISDDYTMYLRYFPVWRDTIGEISTVSILSPHPKQLDLIRSLFPNRSIHSLSRQDWDLANSVSREWDLVVAMNVFHYSQSPELWFNNILDSCKWFWIQDLIYRPRGPKGFGTDGDCMRYSYSPDIVSPYKNAYDIFQLRDSVREFVHYRDTSVGSTAVHFLALLKGRIS